MKRVKRPSVNEACRWQALIALKKESELAMLDQIRSLLAVPMAERTWFLRKRLPGGGSCL
jgi:hypothetical protein